MVQMIMQNTLNAIQNDFNDYAKRFWWCKTLLSFNVMPNGLNDNAKLFWWCKREATFIFSCGQKLCQKIFDYQS